MHVLKYVYIFAPLFIFNARAENGVQACGEYEVRGVTRKDSKQVIKFLINEKSKSEIVFFPKNENFVKLSAYIDIYTQLKVKLDMKQRKIISIKEISLIQPNYLNPASEDNLKLLKEYSTCTE